MESKKTGSTRKRNVLRVLCIVIILVSLSCVTGIFMLTHVPEQYRPLEPSGSSEVNPYLTHYLAPNFHNNIQLDRPFDVVVVEKGINEVIVDEDSLGWSWPVQLNGVTFSAPSVVFSGETIILMGTIDYAGFPVVVSIIGAPKLDEEGLLALNIEKVMAGAVNITPLAKYISGVVISGQMGEVEKNQWLKDLEGSVMRNESFDPVFPIIDSEKEIRLTKVEISVGKLVLGFAPAN